MSMKLIARSRAAFFKLCGKRALLSVLSAPREFQWNSRAKTQAAARRSALPPAGRLSPNASSRSNTSTSPGGYDVSRLFHRCARVDAFRSFLYDESVGRLAQLVRAPALQAGGRRFEPCTAHHPCAPPFRGDVVQLVRTLPCHGRGRGFESRRPRHSFQRVCANFTETNEGAKRVHFCTLFAPLFVIGNVLRCASLHGLAAFTLKQCFAAARVTLPAPVLSDRRALRRRGRAKAPIVSSRVCGSVPQAH